jgi:hypothetical protein
MARSAVSTSVCHLTILLDWLKFNPNEPAVISSEADITKFMANWLPQADDMAFGM